MHPDNDSWIITTEVTLVPDEGGGSVRLPVRVQVISLPAVVTIASDGGHPWNNERPESLDLPNGDRLALRYSSEHFRTEHLEGDAGLFSEVALPLWEAYPAVAVVVWSCGATRDVGTRKCLLWLGFWSC